jgi:phage/plasmid-associated DNA primase
MWRKKGSIRSYMQTTSLIGRILSQARLPELCSSNYITKVFLDLKVSRNSHIGPPLFNEKIRVFSNGALDLTTLELKPLSPDYFVTAALPYPYDPSAECPKFLHFLNEISEGHEDRITFLRAVYHAIIYRRTDLQLFFHVRGRGGTGKSTLATIATALVGVENTITTSLKSLNTDVFEVSN